jgi:hypothetical protein
VYELACEVVDTIDLNAKGGARVPPIVIDHQMTGSPEEPGGAWSTEPS